MYSGSDADLDNTAPVDDTDGYTSNIDNTSKVGTRIDFKFTASGSTDDLSLKLYSRRDSSWDGDEILVREWVVPNDGTEDVKTIVVDVATYGAGHHRFSMTSTAGNDTFDIDAEMRQWRYEIATT